MKRNLFKFDLYKSKLNDINYYYCAAHVLKSMLIFCTLSGTITPYGYKAIAGVTFNPPAGDQPKTSTGGASRSIGECINQAENAPLPLAAIVPDSAAGLTVASHPTVLVYLPETTAPKLFVSWQDEHNEHYQTIISIEDQAGIISITLPEDAPPLEVGKTYQWALALMCDGRLQPDSPMIQGQIQRVALESSLSDRLKNTDALETAALYGEAGIWYETVATLAQLKTIKSEDPNVASNWQELLNSVGLGKFAQAPLIKSNLD